MRGHPKIVPVVPTLSVADLLSRGTSNWETCFPFSSPRGAWALTGRVALYRGLPVLDLPAGSTVLVPCYFHGVEIDTLLTAGLKLEFYRLKDDLAVDLDDAGSRLGGEASALFVIHYFGFPQRLAPIRAFCERHGLKLIEDCALSLFSRDDEGPLGRAGDLALYSVYKTVPVPHGGFVVTKGKRDYPVLRPTGRLSTAVQIKDLVHLGMKARGWNRTEQWVLQGSRALKGALGWKRHEMVGSGYSDWDPRMLEYDASPWVPQLMRLIDPEFVVEKRRANYIRLAGRLRGRAHTPPPFDRLPDGVCPLFYPLWVEDKLRLHREMKSLGVHTINLWNDDHPACPPDLAAEASGWRRHLIELPIHQGLSPEDVDRVADTVLSLL